MKVFLNLLIIFTMFISVKSFGGHKSFETYSEIGDRDHTLYTVKDGNG